eukprot:1126093-Prorocentrum_minimum.AAC.1
MSLTCPVTEVASGELTDVQWKMHTLSTKACEADSNRQHCVREIKNRTIKTANRNDTNVRVYTGMRRRFRRFRGRIEFASLQWRNVETARQGRKGQLSFLSARKRCVREEWWEESNSPAGKGPIVSRASCPCRALAPCGTRKRASGTRASSHAEPTAPRDDVDLFVFRFVQASDVSCSFAERGR